MSLLDRKSPDIVFNCIFYLKDSFRRSNIFWWQIPDSDCITYAGVTCQIWFANFNWLFFFSSPSGHAYIRHFLLSHWVIAFIYRLKETCKCGTTYFVPPKLSLFEWFYLQRYHLNLCTYLWTVIRRNIWHWSRN